MKMTTAARKAVRKIMQKYEHPFDVEIDAIDLRQMSKNFPLGIIPTEAIDEIINAILDNAKGGKREVEPRSIDPEVLNITPKFAWVDIDQTAINPIFQRDVAANHVFKIEKDFDPNKIIVPCAVKDMQTGLYLLWDGHHTSRVASRKGWKKIPVWYIEADVSDKTEEEAMAELILLAGRAFLTINKTNKRPVSRLDEHLIRLECGEHEARLVEDILVRYNSKFARKDDKTGQISHISNTYDVFNLASPDGTRGIYLHRALDFYRSTWPKEGVNGVMLKGLGLMFQMIDVSKGLHTIDKTAFNTELANSLHSVYGSAKIAREEIEEQYTETYGDAGRDLTPVQVANGLMCHYKVHNSTFDIGNSEFTFQVR